jgi:glucose-1-phosphate cytidylyltransferase
LNYSEALTNDFILSRCGKDITLLNRDIEDWTITFVDTGLSASIGQRLKAVEPYLEGEKEFLANYSDGLTDLHLPDLIDYFHRKDKIATFLAVHPNYSFHVVSMKDDDLVEDIKEVGYYGLWINGGYFIFKQEIFDYIKDGEDLIFEPFTRLREKGQLIALTYDGFWASMDTFKDKRELEEIYSGGSAPWEVWKKK